MINSLDITDEYLTEKVSIAKLIRVSKGIAHNEPYTKFWETEQSYLYNSVSDYFRKMKL